ncbi:MAG: M48 family metallopeptidase [Eubacteriaceae bacterium]
MKIKYSKRKTLGLYFTKEGFLEVRVPNGTSENSIQSFVKKHEDWIQKHHETIEEKIIRQKSFRLNYGDSIFLCGEEFELMPSKGKTGQIEEVGIYFREELTEQQLLAEVVVFYKNFAKQYIEKRVLYFSELMGVKPKKIKINGAKTRWGSCTSQGNLNFSWYLIMGEKSCIDYVIVHELAHLIELNHSKEFWRVVEKFQPQYKKEKEKLKKLQNKCSFENWEQKSF